MRDMYANLAHQATVSLIGASKTYIITAVEVARPMRGRGYAKQLLQQVCEEADNQGVTLLLAVEPSEPGISRVRLWDFYKKFGFEEFRGNIDDNTMVRMPKDGKP